MGLQLMNLTLQPFHLMIVQIASFWGVEQGNGPDEQPEMKNPDEQPKVKRVRFATPPASPPSAPTPPPPPPPIASTSTSTDNGGNLLTSNYNCRVLPVLICHPQLTGRDITLFNKFFE